MRTGSVAKHGPGITRRGLVGAAGVLAFPRKARAATRLRLAHGLSPRHPVHAAMTNMASIVQERSKGEVTITIFSDGVLGEEPALLAQVRTGTLDMTKASSSVLTPLVPPFGLFDIPFLFRDRDHWARALGGSVGRTLLDSAARAGLQGLCFYDAGARSFYGTRPIGGPEDLAGLRIRVQPSPAMIRMVQLLGAQPVPLPWGQVYTAFKTGVIDAAENNITALTYGQHADIVRFFATSEHTMVPDVLLMSPRAWGALRPDQRELIRSAAQESALLQGELWRRAEEDSLAQAEALGVSFNPVDKGAFARRLAALKDEIKSHTDLSGLIDAVERT